MPRAVGIKGRPAKRALVAAGQVLQNGKLIFARPTQNGQPMVECLWPGERLMPGHFFMALVAGIVGVAAPEANGYNIAVGMVVHASRLMVG
jgi:hypothetical protein